MMDEVQDVVRLHEDTVQRAEEHAVTYQPERPKPPAPARVKRVKVHPLVWATAKRLADGNLKRLTVLSATEVVVRNP